jgi:GDPmannose 4,6-dehydratase
VIASTSASAIVTGASGQDGYYLVARLLSEGLVVHATIRDADRPADLAPLVVGGRLVIHRLEISDAEGFARLVAQVRPDEFYNLAGQSSVSASFDDPTDTWRTNAHAVQGLLEAIRRHGQATRFYQSSSTDMFGSIPGQAVVHDETSQFLPQSPYAAAKAAAHLLCDAYRRAFDLRIACGILSNHESRRRPASFLTRKVVDHVRRLREATAAGREPAHPLLVGNLAAERDWGFAPDYVEGMTRICRQVRVRTEVLGLPLDADTGSSYRDYVLSSGQLHAVWELVDRAFALGGFPLVWDRSSPDPTAWTAHLEATGALAVVVDSALIRPSDPAAIGADSAKARKELGWRPRPGLDLFLQDMLVHDRVVPVDSLSG